MAWCNRYIRYFILFLFYTIFCGTMVFAQSFNITWNEPTCPEPSNASITFKITTDGTKSETFVMIVNSVSEAKTTKQVIVTEVGKTEYEYSFQKLAYQYRDSETGEIIPNIEYLAYVTDGVIRVSNLEDIYFQKPEFSASIIKDRDAGCTGQAVGQAHDTIDGGIEPYTWEWYKKDDASFPKHANKKQITDMSPGKYFLKVKDDSGCVINSDTLTIATQDISISVTKTDNVTCKDTTNGAIEVAVAGAYGDYNLYWNGDKNHLIDKNTLGNKNLPADTYMIQVVDDIGCEDETGPVYILEPEKKITLNKDSFEDLKCRDIPDGQVSFSVENAVGAVSYEWSDGKEYGLARNDLAADIKYTVTVTDELGCKAQNSVTLSQPDTKVSIAVQDFTKPSCFGYSDGSITALASGGTPATAPNPPYTYYWNAVEGGATISDVPGGDTHPYTIIAKDENGCTDTLKEYILDEPKPLNTTFEINGSEAPNPYSLTCNGNTVNSLKISVEGGTPPYKYKWSGDTEFGSTTEITNVGAGTYTVLVKDKNGEGCEQPVSQTISEPQKLSATISEKTVIQCNGDSGELNVEVNGGVEPYVYQWTNVSSSSATTGAIKKGTYSVTITDGNNCKVSSEYELKEPDVLKVHITVSPEACDDISKGNLVANVTGGTEPYDYHWNTGATTAMLGNLEAKIYTAQITDNHGCSSNEDNIDMTKLKNYRIEVTKSNVTCFYKNLSTPEKDSTSKDGTARVQIISGFSPYKIFWSNGETTKEITNLQRGSYNVRVEDSRGCERKQEITIDTIPSLRVSSLITTPSACKIPTGTATIKINKKTGASPYRYYWYKGSEVISTKTSAKALSAGTYKVEVIDRNNCPLDTSITTVVIENEANLKLAISSEDTIIRCINGKYGVATAIARNGVEPYQFSWSNGLTGETVSNLSAGKYSVTVEDADGCEQTKSIKFVEDDVLTIVDKGQKNVSCNGLSDGYIQIDVKGGVPPYTISWDNNPSAQYANQNLSAGTYTVTVSDSKGCSGVKKTYTITEPEELNVSITNQTHITCADHCDASAKAVVAGGTSPYTIQWPSGEKGETATALCMGNDQQLYIEDANHCPATKNFNVTGREERLMVQTIDIKSPICGELEPSGKITVTATGSLNGDYFYTWKNNGTELPSTTNVLSGYPAGAYVLQLSDGTCDFETTITLSNELDVTSEFQYQESTCEGDSYKIVISNESTANYSYLWDNGNTTQTATGLTDGMHSVEATDKDGCVYTTSFEMVQKHLNPQVTVIDANCYNKANGSATATAENTKGSVFYKWYKKESDELVGSEQTATGLAKGDYYAVVYDDNHTACAESVDFSVNEPKEILLVVSEEMPSYCHLPNGKVSVEIIGNPVTPVTYEWTNNASNTTIGTDAICSVVPSETDISITVTDKVGCAATTTTQITDVTNFSIQEVVQTAHIQCVGSSTAALEVLTNNGYGSFTYEWANHPEATSNTLTGISSGTYKVSITDEKGCKITSDDIVVSDPEGLHIDFDETPRIECQGGSGTLSAIATGGWPSYTYNWYDANNTLLQSSDQSDLECKKGLYKVKITDKYGCESAVFSYEMTEPSELMADFMVDVTECGDNAETGKITINSISGGWEDATYRYKWGTISEDKAWNTYDPDEAQTLSNLPAGTYVCTISYSENPSDCYLEKKLYTNPLIPESIVSESHHTHCNYYTDTEIQNGVTDGSIEVTKLIVSKGSYEESMRSIADLADYTFEWNDSKNQTGTTATNLNSGNYEVTVTGKNGCSKTFTTDKIDSYVKLDAEIFATEDSTIERKQICLGDSLNVSATLQTTYKYDYIPSDNSVTYAWSAVEKNCSATVSTPEEAATWVTPLTTYYADSTQIEFSYTMDGCSSEPVNYTIFHYDSVNFAIQMLDTLGVYVGTDSVAGIQGLRYLFLPVDDPWFVDKTGDNGVASILWRSFKPNKMEKGTLSDTTTNEKTYARSGRTGLLMRIEEPNYLYAVATTIHGCKERTQIFVDVLSSNFVPSGFTPNGDGVNDEWVIPYLNNCPKAKVTVYNRWGVLVYENKIEYATHPWNGTSITGNELPMGTYYYVIEYNDINNTPTRTGAVSIIR